ncbi:MAG: protein kinase, partial [Bryobacteraceae bacterium]
MTGTTISHYSVLERFSEDSAGTIFKAKDNRSGQFVSLRILAEGLSQDAEQRKRFREDMQAASALEHTQIIRVLEEGSADGRGFVAMEALEGETLHDLLKRKRLRRHDMLRHAIQVSDGLQAAHAAGLVHGTLQPSSIVLKPSGLLKILDFGLSHLIAAVPQGKPREDTTDAEWERVEYLSPEHISGKPVDARSDIFCFGTLLYHMSTGRRPFRKETLQATMHAILNSEPAPVAKVSNRTPIGVQKVLDRCLDKDPERRYRDISSVRIPLSRLLGDTKTDPRLRAIEEWIERNRAKFLRRIAAGLAMVALAVIGAIWWKQKATEVPREGRSFRQVTKGPGADFEPSIAADGNLIAFASDRSGEGDLDVWIQAGSDDARRLTKGGGDDHEPAISPDGKSVAYRSERNGALYLVPAAGGEPRLLAEGGRRPRYSPDGRWIAYWTGPVGVVPAVDGEFKVFVVAAMGGPPQQIQPELTVAAFPVWSPDGKSLLFLGRQDSRLMPENEEDWWIAPIERGTSIKTGACPSFRRRTITKDSTCPVPADWKQNFVLFSLPSASGGVSLWRVAVDSQTREITAEPGRVSPGDTEDGQPSMAPEGVIAFVRQKLSAEIWGAEIDANEGKLRGEWKQITSGGGMNGFPTLSADGSKLAFQSNRDGHYQPWLLDMKSGKQAPISSSKQDQLHPRISRDGSKVVYAEIRIRRYEHFSRSTDGTATAMLCETCGLDVYDWTKDGLRMLVEATLARPPAVAILDNKTHLKREILSHPAHHVLQARYSPDEQWVTFVVLRKDGHSRIYTAPLHEEALTPESEWVALTSGNNWDTSPHWSPDGRLVYFTSSRDGRRCIWAQRVDAEARPSGESFAVV